MLGAQEQKYCQTFVVLMGRHTALWVIRAARSCQNAGVSPPPVRGEKLALKARGPEVRYQTSLFRDRHLNDLVGALYAREQACYQSQDKYCQ